MCTKTNSRSSITAENADERNVLKLYREVSCGSSAINPWSFSSGEETNTKRKREIIWK
jgi:hypothetical protein